VQETAGANGVLEEVFVVGREVDMLTKIERKEKKHKLRGESVCRIIEINVSRR